MKIRSLVVENFRAIRKMELTDLGGMIVIAGPNGCGKTQIYHAIRLLKSTYGGYQPNEYQQWWGEFQINLDRPGKEVLRIFRDPQRPFRIHAVFEISEAERAFLIARAETVIRGRIWEELVPGYRNAYLAGRAAVAQVQRLHGNEVEQRTQDELQVVLPALALPELTGELTVHPNLQYQVTPSPGLELLFSTYAPAELGVIDYHGAQRTYNREQLGGINLNLQQSEDRFRQHILYNWNNKYSNIKSELAAGYVRDLIAAEAGVAGNAGATLTQTLQELFTTFFPGKQFPGPTPGPDGTLDFPVIVGGAGEHDIDDLSSGEKEVLFGYLRLRNNAPKNSVLLIDEPELHLNPALLRGLPQFYHKHIGRDLGNQLWLVTHSDALLREAVGQPGFSVFHMQPGAAVPEAGNQVHPIGVGEALDRAVVDLVGDLATYQPGGKVVIFEGGGDSEFDVRMTTTLFPQLALKANPISGGSRQTVENLHDLLRRAAEAGTLNATFFSIVDRDSGEVNRAADAFSWDRYHIENYLLEPRFILAVLADLNIRSDGLRSETGVRTRLVECARDTLPDLVRHELESVANATLVNAVKTNTPRGGASVAQPLHEAVAATRQRVDEAVGGSLSLETLRRLERRSRTRFTQDLASQRWLSTFRGRDVLRRFTDQHVHRVKYEVLRDLILAKMRDQGHLPEGMRRVIDAILDA